MRARQVLGDRPPRRRQALPGRARGGAATRCSPDVVLGDPATRSAAGQRLDRHPELLGEPPHTRCCLRARGLGRRWLLRRAACNCTCRHVQMHVFADLVTDHHERRSHGHQHARLHQDACDQPRRGRSDLDGGLVGLRPRAAAGPRLPRRPLARASGRPRLPPRPRRDRAAGTCTGPRARRPA